MSALDRHIKEEWLDHPETITPEQGLHFAGWLHDNDNDEYHMMLECSSIQSAAEDLVICITLGDDKDTKAANDDLHQAISVEARDYLVNKIEDYRNCYDESDENWQEEISFDRGRL